MIFPVPLSVIGTTGTLVFAATLNAPFYINQKDKTIKFRKKYLKEQTSVKLEIINAYLEKISRPSSASYNNIGMTPSHSERRSTKAYQHMHVCCKYDRTIIYALFWLQKN